MPTRIIGTRIFGRAIGRAIPYVDWTLLAIDVVELLVEEGRNNGNNSPFQGFGGGSFGDGGASGKW